jgi:hypothetical protein
VTPLIGLAFSPVAHFWRWLLCNRSHCSSLRPIIPSVPLIRWQTVQVYPHHPAFPIGGGKSFESGQCSYIHDSQSVISGLFFRFAGVRSLPNVVTFILRSLMEISTARLATSSSMICPRALLNELWLPTRSSHYALRSFIPLFLCGSVRHLLDPDDRVPCAVQAWHDASPSASGGQLVPRPTIAWVRFFSCWRRPTARCWSPYRFFSTPTVFTAASSLKISWCTATDCFHWGWLLTLQTGIRPFSAGIHTDSHPFLMCVHLGCYFLNAWWISIRECRVLRTASEFWLLVFISASNSACSLAISS